MASKNWRRGARVAGVLAAFAVAIGALTPVGAHVNNDFSHLWNDHILPLISTQGTINDSANPLHWTRLKEVPNGIADGSDDDDPTVDPTLYYTSSGGNRTLHVDKNRVLPPVFNKTIENPGNICNSECVVGSLSLPGRSTYAISAKIGLKQLDSDEDLVVQCRLSAGSDDDFADAALAERSGVLSEVIITLPMQFVHTFDRTANASVVCGDFDRGDVRGFNLSITAIRVHP